MQNNLNQVGYQQNVQTSYEKLINQNVQLIKKNQSSTLSDKLVNDNYLLSYLKHYRLKYESTDKPTTSVTLFQRIGDDYMMGIILLSIIFILVNVYATSYVDRLDLVNLLPLNKIKTSIVSIGFGLLVYLSVIILPIITSLILGLFGNGFGNLNYPISSNLIDVERGDYVNIGQILTPLVIIQFLFIIFMVMFIYLIVILAKDKINSLFILIIATFGPIISIYFFKPFSQKSQFIPFSFFNGLNIVTNRLGAGISNLNLTYQNGILILLISILIIIIILFGLDLLRRNM
ncbi:hypothetical protein [Lactobacillus sp. Sy-1]|uniref:hypothetical protein n=1 Tax=Lactobacillus sp. Sy-1 TaxID=2109645 RepID=UPI001C5A9BB9|nr:hypothetical protein [Lactobacillus sp. Sy-1]MBW1606316.1 hypothetical protein [Lactobacillus sp. Sy-1]